MDPKKEFSYGKFGLSVNTHDVDFHLEANKRLRPYIIAEKVINSPINYISDLLLDKVIKIGIIQATVRIATAVVASKPTEKERVNYLDIM
jgi:hypothetical protein